MAGKKAEDKAVGMYRGGRNTKIHTLVDGLGNPLAFMLSSGADHNSKHAVPLLQQIDIEGSNILGDKAIRSQSNSRLHCFSECLIYHPAERDLRYSLACRLAFLQRAPSN